MRTGTTAKPKTTKTTDRPNTSKATASGVSYLQGSGGFGQSSGISGKKDDKPKPNIKRCVVEGCRMNQVTVHQSKNTFRSLVGLELEEIFRGKEDDAYIDELISKKLNINNFYDPEDEDREYFAEFAYRRAGGAVLEDKLLKNFNPIEKTCGFHQFLLMKHKELRSSLQASHAQDKSSPDARLKVVLMSYRKFFTRFWPEAHFKLFADLQLLVDQITNVFGDVSIMKMSTAQLEIAKELLSTLSLFAAKHKLNEVVNYFNLPSCRYIGNNLVETYITAAKTVVNDIVSRNIRDLMDIVNSNVPEKQLVWMGVLQLVGAFSNEVTETHLAEQKAYLNLAEVCLTGVFLVESNHKGTPVANDMLFYSLTVFVHGLYSSATKTHSSLVELLLQSKISLESIFLRKVDSWSKSLLEAFIVMLFTNFGDDVYSGFMRLPKYRVLKKYHDDGYEDLTTEKFLVDDWLEVLHKIEELKFVVSLEVQELIDNYISAADPEPLQMITGFGAGQSSATPARIHTGFLATNSSAAFNETNY